MRERVVLMGLLFLMPEVLCAQAQPEDTQQRLKALEERIRILEDEIRALKAAQAVAAPAPTPPGVAPPTVQAPVGAPGVPAGPLPVYGGASALAKIFNPDISVIGDFQADAGRNAVRPLPTLRMRETEIALQAIVDPYARADFFVELGPEGVELEEGYLTFTSLPGGLVPRAGKMRAGFGKVNAVHNDALPWADRPLVTENLLGGEEGVSDTGFSVSRILPAPKGIFLEATGQVFRGESGDVFVATKKSDVSFVGHFRGYQDLTESTNVDLGLSYARGHNDLGSDFLTQLYGVDATLRWKPLRRAIYHSFLTRTEVVWSRRREQLPATQRAMGFYTSADYRVNRRWTVGGRYDRSDRMRDASLSDRGFSAVVTYWPSEFSQVRAQYRRTRFAEGQTANELLFQLLFSLGVHGAHPF